MTATGSSPKSFSWLLPQFGHPPPASAALSPGEFKKALELPQWLAVFGKGESAGVRWGTTPSLWWHGAWTEGGWEMGMLSFGTAATRQENLVGEACWSYGG